MPTFLHGKGAYFAIDDQAGSLTDISNVLEEVTFPRTQETAEKTAFGDDSKVFIAGLLDSTISISGHFDTEDDGVDELFGTILANPGSPTTLSFEFGPNGSTPAVGSPVYQGECILTSYEVGAPVGDNVSFSAEFQVTGDVTRAVA